MTKNLYASPSGKLYNVCSYDVVCRRKIPQFCNECGELMHHEIVDSMIIYDVLLCTCRNGHERTVFIDKREEEKDGM